MSTEEFGVEGEVRLAAKRWRDRPDAPGLILLHGGSGNLEYFDAFAPKLAANYEVVAYDLRGHGRSGDGPQTLDGHVSDLMAVFRSLPDEAPLLVGASFGAVVAIAAAAAHDDRFGGVVSIEGPVGDRLQASLVTAAAVRESLAAQGYPFEGSSDDLAVRVRDAAARGQHGEHRKYAEVAPGQFRQRPSLDDRAALVVLGFTPMHQRLLDLGIPGCLIVGTRSPLDGSPEGSLAAASDLVARNPRLHLETLEGGHDLVSDIPEQVATVIARWSSELVGPP